MATPRIPARGPNAKSDSPATPSSAKAGVAESGQRLPTPLRPAANPSPGKNAKTTIKQSSNQVARSEPPVVDGSSARAVEAPSRARSAPRPGLIRDSMRGATVLASPVASRSRKKGSTANHHHDEPKPMLSTDVA